MRLKLIFFILFLSNLLYSTEPDKTINVEQLFSATSENGLAFKYPNSNDKYLQELKTKFKLEDLVKNCKSELEKVLKVTNWVHNLWEHNSDNVPEKSDPLSILIDVIENKKQFRCVEYSIVLAGCLNSLGITSRVVYLATKDVETREYGAGHVIAEAFLPSLNKWIMIDTQANIIPVLNNIPLNAIELQKAITNNSLGLNIISLKQIVKLQEYIKHITQYLYYFKTSLSPNEYNKNEVSLMLIPNGAKKPTVFQITNPIINVIYTFSESCFYKQPELNMKNIQIIKANKNDVFEIAKLLHTSWHATFNSMLPQAYIEKQTLEFLQKICMDVFEKDIKDHIVFLAKKENELLGFIEVGPLKDKAENLKDYDSEIYRLYVNNNCKRQGIGKQLLNTGLQYLKEHVYNKTVVKVFHKNIEAIKFYEKMGGKFILQEELEDYHGSLLFNVYGYENIEIETNNLILRNWKKEDFETMHSILQDKDVNQFLTIYNLTNKDVLEKFLTNTSKNIQEKSYGYFACIEKKTGKLMGYAGLNYVTLNQKPFPCWTISYVLDKPYWGKGYATQAATALLKYGFEKFNLKEIFACAVKENIKSQEVMKKLNMQFVCEFDFPGIDKEHPHCKHVLYAITQKPVKNGKI